MQQTKKIIKLNELRERKQRLLSKLHDISCLRDVQATVQMLLNQNDYPKVIDCIETSQEVLESELGGVSCFRWLFPTFFTFVFSDIWVCNWMNYTEWSEK